MPALQNVKFNLLEYTKMLNQPQQSGRWSVKLATVATIPSFPENTPSTHPQWKLWRWQKDLGATCVRQQGPGGWRKCRCGRFLGGSWIRFSGVSEGSPAQGDGKTEDEDRVLTDV